MNDDGLAIVSVRRSDLARTTDFALATNRQIAELASIITESLGWEGPFEIVADPPGRLLRSTETLAEAGVWDGASLVIQAPGATTSVGRNRAVEPGPLYTWKRVDGS